MKFKQMCFSYQNLRIISKYWCTVFIFHENCKITVHVTVYLSEDFVVVLRPMLSCDLF